ncbi:MULTISPECIES: hypothetical protein [Burkholderia]|uniref:hypothetical protein n=1 Tax=Burkholderia TaxID=32008 RepID=UPI0003FC38ED|nr:MULTISPECIES: hypothetical protein [Burkholderia]KML21046.1 hypothetical protein VL00_03630 [Burkholderia cepacia]MBE2968358.1 hypothetical protein [Burkholderia cepacia]
MLTPIVGGADFCHLDDVLEPGDHRKVVARVDHLTARITSLAMPATRCTAPMSRPARSGGAPMCTASAVARSAA